MARSEAPAASSKLIRLAAEEAVLMAENAVLSQKIKELQPAYPPPPPELHWREDDHIFPHHAEVGAPMSRDDIYLFIDAKKQYWLGERAKVAQWRAREAQVEKAFCDHEAAKERVEVDSGLRALLDRGHKIDERLDEIEETVLSLPAKTPAEIAFKAIVVKRALFLTIAGEYANKAYASLLNDLIAAVDPAEPAEAPAPALIAAE